MAVERAGGAYLWGLRLDFTGTSEGSVDFTHDCGLELSFGCWFLSWVATKPRYSLELSFTFDTFFFSCWISAPVASDESCWRGE